MGWLEYEFVSFWAKGLFFMGWKCSFQGVQIPCTCIWKKMASWKGSMSFFQPSIKNRCELFSFHGGQVIIFHDPWLRGDSWWLVGKWGELTWSFQLWKSQNSSQIQRLKTWWVYRLHDRIPRLTNWEDHFIPCEFLWLLCQMLFPVSMPYNRSDFISLNWVLPFQGSSRKTSPGKVVFLNMEPMLARWISPPFQTEHLKTSTKITCSKFLENTSPHSPPKSRSSDEPKKNLLQNLGGGWEKLTSSAKKHRFSPIRISILQVAIANEVFSPGEAEVTQARRALALC